MSFVFHFSLGLPCSWVKPVWDRRVLLWPSVSCLEPNGKHVQVWWASATVLACEPALPPSTELCPAYQCKKATMCRVQIFQTLAPSSGSIWEWISWKYVCMRFSNLGASQYLYLLRAILQTVVLCMKCVCVFEILTDTTQPFLIFCSLKSWSEWDPLAWFQCCRPSLGAFPRESLGDLSMFQHFWILHFTISLMSYEKVFIRLYYNT